MRTQSLHASLLSSRNSTPLCGTGREGSHRVHEDPDTEAMRVKGSVRLTAEVANGMRLIGEVKRP